MNTNTEVLLKTNPRSIAAVQRRTTSQTDVFDNIPAGFAAVLEHLSAANVEPIGPPTTVFHRIPDGDTDGEIAMRLPIATSIDADDGVEIVTLAEHTVASLVHEGSYETLGETYATIAAWIHDQGHTISGPNTETYFNSPADVAEADLRTEVAFPVAVPGPR